MSISNSNLNKYIENKTKKLDLKSSWYKSVNLTKLWLNKNLSLMGNSAEEEFIGGFKSLTKETEIDGQIIYGTGISLHENSITEKSSSGLLMQNANYAYESYSPVNVNKGSFSFTDGGKDSGVDHSLDVVAEEKTLSFLSENVSGFSSNGEYPNKIISCACPESILNVLNYLEETPQDFGSSSSILNEAGYSPLNGIVVDDKESVLNYISPLNISSTEEW